MSNTLFFTPGPTQLYPETDLFIQEALEKDVCSISHRSQAFKDIYKKTADNLRELINLPSDWHILFTGSASEVWERLLTNCCDKKSTHFVNGSFSKKFYQYALALGKDTTQHTVDFGKGISLEGIETDSATELVCLTHNETSAGTSTPVTEINKARDLFPNALIAVDTVSSVPYPDYDYSKIDSLFFSVQKCFGLPAGLGVWVVNEKCIEKATSLQKKGKVIGAHHDILELKKKAVNNQTPSTPNVLTIFLLGKVAGKMLAKGGANQLRKETEQKYDILCAAIEKHPAMSLFVEDEYFRSRTVVVANTSITPTDINAALKPLNMQVGAGYGDKKTTQIRIANFPAFSVEQVKELAEVLGQIKE
ncbi:MAG: aminotransferase class V-fold PLP-dependent enzyme [Cyclobacteriaceae bacterium]